MARLIASESSALPSPAAPKDRTSKTRPTGTAPIADSASWPAPSQAAPATDKRPKKQREFMRMEIGSRDETPDRPVMRGCAQSCPRSPGWRLISAATEADCNKSVWKLLSCWMFQENATPSSCPSTENATRASRLHGKDGQNAGLHTTAALSISGALPADTKAPILSCIEHLHALR